MPRKVASTTVRKDSLLTLLAASRRCEQLGRVVVLRGPEGIGKTHLIESAARQWRKEGVRVLQVSTGDRAGIDRYGVDATLAALRRDTGPLREPGLIDGISAVAGLRVRAPEDSPGWFPAVSGELRKLFGAIGRTGRTVVTFDDVHNVGEPAWLLAAIRRPGCLLVASVSDDAEPAFQSELAALSDEVIDLEALPSAQIAKVTGRKLDADVHVALHAALGPLYGNPGAVLSTVEMLWEQGRLGAEEDGGLCLRDVESPIPLPEGHELVRRVRQLDEVGPGMVLLTADRGGIYIDDLPLIADTLGESLDACGQAIDRLVEARVLLEDGWGKLTCLCPALADSFRERDDAATRRPHTVAGLRPVRQESTARADSEATAGCDHDRTSRTVGHRSAWSDKEIRIVELISNGFTNRQIAADLGVSEKSVEQYLSRLFRKFGCRSRVGLVTAMLERPATGSTRAGAAQRRPSRKSGDGFRPVPDVWGASRASQGVGGWRRRRSSGSGSCSPMSKRS